MIGLRLIPGIHRATHRIGLYLAQLRHYGLSQGEAHILALLAHASPLTVGELHKGLAHKRSTLTSIVDRLVARGFVTRETGRTDRRTFVIELTGSGNKVARGVHRHLLDLEGAVTAGFSRGELDAFSRVLAAVEREANRRTKGQR